MAAFLASSVSTLDVGFSWNFTVTPGGDVYQLFYVKKDANRYVVAFNKDGTYKSKIKLDAGFELLVSQVAVFPEGELLVTGQKFVRDGNKNVKWPFTGIFSASGNLLKEVSLKDDEELYNMASSNDPKVVSAPGRGTNSPVERGVLEVGDDGNAYVMRRLSPAIVYVLSPGGAVVRRLLIDPGAGKKDYMPLSMHVSHGRIAILFHDSQTRNQVLKVIDLEGQEVATYQDDPVNGKPTLGVSFACFSSVPERYVFLGETADNRLEFKTAEPR